MPNNPNAINNLKPFKKGQSGNPKGRSKGIPNTATRLKRLLEITQNLTNPITDEVEGFTVAEQLDFAQIIKAKKGDTRAYIALLDRLEGKPKQETEIKGDINIALVEFIGDDSDQENQSSSS